MAQGTRQRHECGWHYVFQIVYLVEMSLMRFRRQFPEFYITSSMRNSSHTAQYTEGTQFFGQVKEPFRHIFGFLEVTWFHQRNVQPFGYRPRILLIRAGYSRRVIAAY